MTVNVKPDKLIVDTVDTVGAVPVRVKVTVTLAPGAKAIAEFGATVTAGLVIAGKETLDTLRLLMSCVLSELFVTVAVPVMVIAPPDNTVTLPNGTGFVIDQS